MRACGQIISAAVALATRKGSEALERRGFRSRAGGIDEVLLFTNRKPWRAQTMRSILFLAAACIALAVAPSVARADDVTDAIEQGRKAYQSGDFASAKQALDLASQL